jgi:exopolysaccharide biosynthesis polyprenyl glycosylphosphotransferase
MKQPARDSRQKIQDKDSLQMFHERSIQFAALVVVLDLLISVLVFLVLLGMHPLIFPGGEADYLAHLGILSMVLALFLGLRLSPKSRQQPPLNYLNTRQIIWLILKDQLILFTICMGFIFVLKLTFVSRFVVVGYFMFVSMALISTRLFIVWWYFGRDRTKKHFSLKILIIGSGRRARLLADQLRNESEWGVSIVGFLDPEGWCAGRRKEDAILGEVHDISRVLRDNVVDEVIVAVPRSLVDDVQRIGAACQEEGVKLRFMADFYDFDAARVSLATVNKIPLLTFESVAMSEFSLMIRRIFDMIVVLAFSPLIALILLILAAAIKLDSPGPVFFLQERVGLHKRRFKMIKLRTMVVDAEARMKEVEHLNEAKGPNFKIKDDPRITRVGGFLRKSSLDELPQLINVLRGQMSLVGPRPMSVRDVDLFDSAIQRKRFSARPGMTCLWQISGRSDLDFDDWLKLDLYYIDNWSIWLDLKILVKTIPCVLRGSGAA